MIRRSILALAAVGLLSTPSLAHASARGTAPAVEESELVGNPWIPIAVGIAAIVALLLIALDDDSPSSP